jgi:hypothetical protein
MFTIWSCAKSYRYKYVDERIYRACVCLCVRAKLINSVLFLARWKEFAGTLVKAPLDCCIMKTTVYTWSNTESITSVVQFSNGARISVRRWQNLHREIVHIVSEYTESFQIRSHRFIQTRQISQKCAILYDSSEPTKQLENKRPK